MKKIIIYLLAMLTIFTITACQPTPETPIVIGKGDGLLEQKIEEQVEPVMADIPQSGEHITDSFKHKTLDVTVNVDAYVENTGTDGFPAVKIEPDGFSDEKAGKIINYFVADNHFLTYKQGEEEPKQLIEIELAKQEKNYEERVKEGANSADLQQRFETSIAARRKELITAKDASEFPAASKTFKIDSFNGGTMIYGFFAQNNHFNRLIMHKIDSGKGDNLWFCRLDGNYLLEEFGINRVEINDVDLSSARKLAEDCIAGLGAEDMTIYEEKPLFNEDPELDGYLFTYTKGFGGVSGVYGTNVLPYRKAHEEDDEPKNFSEPWQYETVKILVDKYGVANVIWEAPSKITQTLANKTAILPFSSIMNTFRKMMLIKNTFVVDAMDFQRNVDGKTIKTQSIDIYISKINLGLLRVQSGKDFLLIPVWDFSGTQKTHYENDVDSEKLIPGASEQVFNYLTLNAIDGSVIDKELGY